MFDGPGDGDTVARALTDGTVRSYAAIVNHPVASRFHIMEFESARGAHNADISEELSAGVR